MKKNCFDLYSLNGYLVSFDGQSNCWFRTTLSKKKKMLLSWLKLTSLWHGCLYQRLWKQSLFVWKNIKIKHQFFKLWYSFNQTNFLSFKRSYPLNRVKLPCAWRKLSVINISKLTTNKCRLHLCIKEPFSCESEKLSPPQQFSRVVYIYNII